MTPAPRHATVVAAPSPQGWRGLLIQGPSGVGKSDLALRLMRDGWRLVGDDWVQVWACRGRLYATAPASIAGRMEVRGLGIIDRPFLPLARLALAMRLTHEPVERLPEPAWETIDGVRLPRLDLDPRPASATLAAATALRAAATATPAAL